MPDEIIKIDQNSRWVLGAVTNDSNAFIRNVRVNPITGALIVEANVTSNNTMIGSTIPGGHQGSVLFLDTGSTLAEDNSHFFYNPVTHRLALGHASPSATLDVVGSFQFVDGNQGDTYVLICDSAGNAAWNNLALNTTFIDNLIANNYFTTTLANNNDFITELTTNSTFIDDITVIITTEGSLTIEDEGTPLAGLATTLNFVGSGVTVTGGGATKTITIPGGGAGAVQSVTDNGNGHVTVNNTDPVNPVIGFDGVSVDGVTVTGTGLAGSPLVAVITGKQVNIQFEDQSGTHLGTAGTVNEFEITGTGVSGARAGDKVTYTISSSGNSVCATITQTAHGFSVGNVLKSSGTANQFAKAKADTASNAEVVGIVTSVIDANNFVYCKDIMGYTGAGIPTDTAGKGVFLDATTAGAMTTTEPTASGTISKPVGVLIASAAAMNFTADYRGLINI